MRLILFDIDGTLLDSGGAGKLALNLAFQEMFLHSEAFEGISMAGKTDPQIIDEALSNHSISAGKSLVLDLLKVYTKHLSRCVTNSGGRLKPGVEKLVSRLSVASGVRLGLLTGNIEQGARVKLGAFGLNEQFPFGAFGSDASRREDLLPVALERFTELTGCSVNYADCIVVGDTPRDIECATPYGAFTVGVATGPFSALELRESGADEACENLLECKVLNELAPD